MYKRKNNHQKIRKENLRIDNKSQFYLNNFFPIKIVYKSFYTSKIKPFH